MLGTERDVGLTELLHGNVEWPIIVLFALITQLGDVWFLFLLGGVLYFVGEELPRWGIDRRRGLFVLALVLSYVALIGVLKAIFLLPRPPGAGEPLVLEWLPAILEPIFTDVTTAEGPGFPSGHALGATMVWGGLALVIRRGSFRTRVGVAGALVVLVSTSRLILGVHYLVDVIAGMLVGLPALGALYWLADRGTDPDRVLGAAAALGIVGLLLGVTDDSVAAAGGAVGGWLAWRGVAGTTPHSPTTRGEIVAGFIAMGILGTLFVVVYALDPPHPVTFLGTALTVGGVVAIPTVAARLG